MGARTTQVQVVTRTNLPNRPAAETPVVVQAAASTAAAVTRNRIQVEVLNQYIHTQSVASATWTISHNLNKYPPVTLVDGSGFVMTATVQYLNANQVQATFSSAVTGSAYLG